MEALVASQERYVYSIALGVMKNPADAADMTQEAFIRLLRGIGSYRDDTKLTTWLYRLVVNVCLDELRRRKRPVDSLEAAGAWGRRTEPADRRRRPLGPARGAARRRGVGCRAAPRDRPAERRPAARAHPPLLRRHARLGDRDRYGRAGQHGQESPPPREGAALRAARRPAGAAGSRGGRRAAADGGRPRHDAAAARPTCRRSGARLSR